VATADGVLRLLVLQKPGGRRQPVDVFVRGWSPTA
jgi:methionyl-tRNA formyltransferase